MKRFQVRLFQWTFPRYANVRWAELKIALGPLHFCRLTLEPSDTETDALRPIASESPPLHARRIELPETSLQEAAPVSPSPSKDTSSISPPRPATPATAGLPPGVRASLSHPGSLPAAPASPSAAGTSVPGLPSRDKGAPYLDDEDLNLLANLLCDPSGNAAPLASRSGLTTSPAMATTLQSESEFTGGGSPSFRPTAQQNFSSRPPTPGEA
jgi:hypothetical protein